MIITDILTEAWPDRGRARGSYQAAIIQRMANRILQEQEKNDGIVLSEKYRPFPMPAMALILAAVCIVSFH